MHTFTHTHVTDVIVELIAMILIIGAQTKIVLMVTLMSFIRVALQFTGVLPRLVAVVVLLVGAVVLLLIVA